MDRLLLNGAATLLAIHDAGIRRPGAEELLDEKGFENLRNYVEREALVAAARTMLESPSNWHDDDRRRMETYLQGLLAP